MRKPFVIVAASLLMLAGFVTSDARERRSERREQIPARANQLRDDMTRSAFRVFGPSAPVATLAAQIHQESGWRTDAVSHVGAEGLAQFMPGTAQEMARQHPRECAPALPGDAKWAFRCRDRYMQSLNKAMQSMSNGLSECARWTFGLRAYNGGLGWINRDRKLTASRGHDADNPDHVARFNAGRSAAAFRENVEYAPRIHNIAARYVAAGWGDAICEAAPL